MAKKKAKRVSRKQPVSIVSDDIFIPNHSGMLDAGKVHRVPTEELDPVNKKYVDDEIDSDISTHAAITNAHHSKTISSEIDHTQIQNIGTNSHSQIDTHISNEPSSSIATHAALPSVHHSRYTDAEVDAIVATHTAIPTAHHDNSTDHASGSDDQDISGIATNATAIALNTTHRGSAGGTDHSDVNTNNAKVTNVSTNLSAGARTATTIKVDSSDGTDATLVEADTTNAGILGSNKWDEIVANTAKVSYTDAADVSANTTARHGVNDANSSSEPANANIQAHISDNSQAHSDYLLNTTDSMTGTLFLDAIGTGLDVLHTAEIGNHLIVGDNLTVDTNTLFVDSTNKRVGIGTTSPEQKLHISGDSSNIELQSTGVDVNDEQKWLTEAGHQGVISQKGFLKFWTLTDAGGIGEVWLEVSRSGTAVNKITFGNGNVEIGGDLTVTGTITGGGAMVLLETITASNSATIDFTTNIDSTYDSYEIRMTGIVAGTNNDFMKMRIYDGGVLKTGATDYEYVRWNVVPGHSSTQSTGNSLIELVPVNTFGSATGENGGGVVTLWTPSSATLSGGIDWDMTVRSAAANQPKWYKGMGRYQSNNAIDGVQFYMNTGNIASGKFSLYGIAS
ncbi:hypothetical protein LCGC14_2173620 [marine sediment metagenome]|uniref:Uncharacterized protein n=1 Tax=marine sediment metagenome TaxID=412755 RepID=A0A0F9EBI3_9ZZZZ